MSEPSEPTSKGRDSVRDGTNFPFESEEEQVSGAEAQQEEAQQPRRSQRIRVLTEKGKEMQDEKIKALQQRFDYSYKWKLQVKSSKQPLSQTSESVSDDLLKDIIDEVTSLSADVQRVYDELHKVSTPDQDTR